MKSFHALATVLSCAMLFTGLSPVARADDYWNRKTFVTFSGAVEVPGAVLPAGTYVFQRVDYANSSDRHSVLITDLRGTHVYARVFAIPSYRANPSDKTVISFYEVPAGNPPPVKLWFYAGDEWGQRLEYGPKRMAEILALGRQRNDNVQTASIPAVQTQPAVSEPQTTAPQESAQAPDDGIQAPAPAVAPTEPTVSPAPVEVTPEAQQQTTPDTTPTPDSLPQTASVMPLVGLIGLVSLLSAFGLRTVRHSS